MERASAGPPSDVVTTDVVPNGEQYRPPRVEWEEEFDPVAASPTCSCLDPDCHDPICG
jgi:hypothetical protein